MVSLLDLPCAPMQRDSKVRVAGAFPVLIESWGPAPSAEEKQRK